jgi:hypothetical protein
MLSKELLGYVSVACAAIGYGYYIRSVLLRRTKPHAFSWGVWSLLMLIVFLAQMSKGAEAGGWVAGFSTGACIIANGSLALMILWRRLRLRRYSDGA